MDFDENPKCYNSLWLSILGSIIGGYVLFLILKRSLENPSIGTVGSQYVNDENWTLSRGEDGRISNLSVSRNAQINSGIHNENKTSSSVIYKPLSDENRGCEITYSDRVDNNRINNRIDVDLLTSMVQTRLQKRWEQLNKKENDYQRQKRFGMV
jgi:hypothetical protein